MIQRAVLLALSAVLLPHLAIADVRHESIPKAYRGTWAPGTATCNEAKSLIVLSAKRYVSPEANCAIEYVSEIPGEGGAIYSARLQCACRAGQAGKRTANLIIRPGDAGRVSVGPRFESLTVYQRCSASGPGATH